MLTVALVDADAQEAYAGVWAWGRGMWWAPRLPSSGAVAAEGRLSGIRAGLFGGRVVRMWPTRSRRAGPAMVFTRRWVPQRGDVHCGTGLSAQPVSRVLCGGAWDWWAAGYVAGWLQAGMQGWIAGSGLSGCDLCAGTWGARAASSRFPARPAGERSG